MILYNIMIILSTQNVGTLYQNYYYYRYYLRLLPTIFNYYYCCHIYILFCRINTCYLIVSNILCYKPLFCY